MVRPTAAVALLLAVAGSQLAAAQFTSTGGMATSGMSGSSVGTGSSFSTSAASAASGVGDPLMTDFVGRSFEFFGKVGGFYNLLSTAQHQLTTHMKPAVMFDHNGTYMDAFSFRYRDHSVEVTLLEKDELSVVLDGKAITMQANEVESEHILGLAEGQLQLLYQLHRPEYGVAVEVSTELLQIVMWMTPAGTFDEGGLEQPAYLNFEVQLLSVPTSAMDGVIGHTYSSATEDADDHQFHHPAAEFEMTSFADNEHEHNLFTSAVQQESQPSSARKLLRAAVSSSSEALSKGFPMRASGRGASRLNLRQAKAGKNGVAVLTAGARMG